MGSTVMTAVPEWDIVGPSGTDAELVMASAAGDRDAFAGIYDRYAHRLHDFCCGMLRDRDSAADCVQDVFCIAAARMTQLREPDKLRPWLYAIARTEALRRLRDRQRETVSDELPDAESDDPSPELLAARTELADLVAEAAGGLSDRDRSVLELAYRHGLDGADLAQALGVSQSTAHVIAHRLRETIERTLGALLVSRGVRADPDRCADLAEILAGWDGTFTVLMRKRISRHIEKCAVCSEERRRLVNPVALLGAAPVFIPAPQWLRDRTLGEIELVNATDTIGGGARHGVRDKLPAVLFTIALLASLGLTVIWLQQRNTVAVTPVEVSQTVPPPVAPVKPNNTPPPTAKVLPPPAEPPSPRQAPTVQAPPPRVVEQPPVVEPQPEPPPAPPPVVDEPPPVVEDPPPVSPDPIPEWQWPEWQWPQWPQPDPERPGVGRLTGPSDIVIDQPGPQRVPDSAPPP
ncbi:hypothetical protein MAGR_11040 [Mycolicibacterium agri]|uniref:RNA polymerase sigma-70 region 2 domain-containing protein n=2 Tax=Mycolicibacterium agri TaxID=36811 RepID=A0A7I9VWC5_MYCAG|nr:hypothetical protein MAGR_11040 [Mycolicibacterium agri]